MTAAQVHALGDEVRLARLHLRVGMLAMAHAELEDLERRHLLDDHDRAVLAEARWRAGDATGAAVAARAHLDGGGTDPIALCIAAESASADGRPAEARALMERLGPPDGAALDALFAGMPRRGFWPSTAGDGGEAAPLFAELGRAVHEAKSGGAATGPEDRHPPGHAAPRVARESAIPGPKQVIDAAPGLWPDAASTGAEATASDRSRRRLVVEALARDPVAELHLGREELGVEPDRGLLRLALTLRLDPTLAPAVLDLVAGRPEPAAAILRGDAQRLLGRHLEAEAAFAAVAATLGEDASKPRS